MPTDDGPEITLYGIGNCDTCRRARRWLEARGTACRFHDLRRDGLAQPTLERWLQTLEPRSLVNRKGTTWRRLPADRREGLDAAGLRSLLLEQPTLIKRPVVEWGDGAITVGFDANAWQERLG